MRPFQSENLDQLAPALVAAQSEMGPLECDKEVEAKNREGKFLYKFSYATLASIHQQVGPILARHGLVITQGMVPFDRPEIQWSVPTRDGSLPAQVLGSVRTMLLHASGQYLAWEHPVGGEWTDQGSIAGEGNKGRRFDLKAACGIADVGEPPAAADRPRRATGNAPARSTAPPPRQATPTAQSDLDDLAEFGSPPEPDSYRDPRNATTFAQEQHAARLAGTPPPQRQPPPPGKSVPRDASPEFGPPCPYPNFPKGGFFGWTREKGLIPWFSALGKSLEDPFPDQFTQWNSAQIEWACCQYEIERTSARASNGAAR